MVLTCMDSQDDIKQNINLNPFGWKQEHQLLPESEK